MPQLDLQSRLANLPLKDSEGYITDEGEEAREQIIINENSLESNDIDECDEAMSDSNSIINKNAQINIAINCGKSGDGWFIISNIVGDSEDPFESMKQAMEKLKCRYALARIVHIKSMRK